MLQSRRVSDPTTIICHFIRNPSVLNNYLQNLLNRRFSLLPASSSRAPRLPLKFSRHLFWNFNAIIESQATNQNNFFQKQVADEAPTK